MALPKSIPAVLQLENCGMGVGFLLELGPIPWFMERTGLRLVTGESLPLRVLRLWGRLRC